MLEEGRPFGARRQRPQAPTQAYIGMSTTRGWRQTVNRVDQLGPVCRKAQHWHGAIEVWSCDPAETIPSLLRHPTAPRPIGIVPSDLVIISGAAIGGAGIQIQLATTLADARLRAGEIEIRVARSIIVPLPAIDFRQALAAAWA